MEFKVGDCIKLKSYDEIVRMARESSTDPDKSIQNLDLPDNQFIDSWKPLCGTYVRILSVISRHRYKIARSHVAGSASDILIYSTEIDVLGMKLDALDIL